MLRTVAVICIGTAAALVSKCSLNQWQDIVVRTRCAGLFVIHFLFFYKNQQPRWTMTLLIFHFRMKCIEYNMDIIRQLRGKSVNSNTEKPWFLLFETSPPCLSISLQLYSVYTSRLWVIKLPSDVNQYSNVTGYNRMYIYCIIIQYMYSLIFSILTTHRLNY